MTNSYWGGGRLDNDRRLGIENESTIDLVHHSHARSICRLYVFDLLTNLIEFECEVAGFCRMHGIE